MAGLNPVDAVLVTGAVAAALLTIWKVVIPLRRRLRETSLMVMRMLYIIAGRPALPDPDRPGRLLREAIPDMGTRMTAVEDKLDAIAVRDLRLDMEQARKAADHAARDARLALKGVSDLRAAAEVWHADGLGVLTGIEAERAETDDAVNADTEE